MTYFSSPPLGQERLKTCELFAEILHLQYLYFSSPLFERLINGTGEGQIEDAEKADNSEETVELESKEIDFKNESADLTKVETKNEAETEVEKQVEVEADVKDSKEENKDDVTAAIVQQIVEEVVVAVVKETDANQDKVLTKETNDGQLKENSNEGRRNIKNVADELVDVTHLFVKAKVLPTCLVNT